MHTMLTSHRDSEKKGGRYDDPYRERRGSGMFNRSFAETGSSKADQIRELSVDELASVRGGASPLQIKGTDGNAIQLPDGIVPQPPIYYCRPEDGCNYIIVLPGTSSGK